VGQHVKKIERENCYMNIPGGEGGEESTKRRRQTKQERSESVTQERKWKQRRNVTNMPLSLFGGNSGKTQMGGNFLVKKRVRKLWGGGKKVKTNEKKNVESRE